MMKRYNVSVSEDIDKRLEQERKRKGLETIPETIRFVLSEWYQSKG